MGGAAVSELIHAISCVMPSGDGYGEAAVWDAEHGMLYWCDVTRFLVHRFDPRHRSRMTWCFDEPVVALSLTEDADLLLVALGSKLIGWRPATDERRDHGFRLANYPEMRFNEGRADLRGNFSEIAELALPLASDASGFTTGAVHVIDGGMVN
jgi:sugar lactone lactonase YvrE